MSHKLHKGTLSEGMTMKGGRRPTGIDIPSENENFASTAQAPNPEAVIRPARRRFTAKYKMEILDAYDRCTSSEERGALMRKEGIYSSSLANWRKARAEGVLSALTQKRGRPKTRTPQEEEMALLKAENQRLQERLAEAEAINEIQKKVSEIFGNRIKKPNQNEEN
jgi:transposase-like protein